MRKNSQPSTDFYRTYGEAFIPTVATYIATVAQEERGDYSDLIETLDQTSEYVPSLLIGRACTQLAIAEDDPLASGRADDDLGYAYELLLADNEALTTQQLAQNVLFKNVVQILTYRDNPEALTNLQLEQHRGVLQGVKQGPPTYDQPFGIFVEQSTLGLLTRVPHPQRWGTPALIHHNKGRQRKDNYDLLYVERANGQQTTVAKLQVKTECFDSHDAKRGPRAHSYEYATDITLVSGCCDIGQGRLYKDLSAEASNTLKPASHQGLQDASSRLIHRCHSTDREDFGRLAPSIRARIDQEFIDWLAEATKYPVRAASGK